jgi:hypothetical protein
MDGVKILDFPKKNCRDVYTDKNGNHYSIGTQNGPFEVLDTRGKHQREVDFFRKRDERSG